MREEVLLVYGMNGSPRCRSTGLPDCSSGWYGMANVKWLTRITASPGRTRVIRTPSAIGSAAIPTSRGSRASRMRVRSLMVPAGIPSFPSGNGRSPPAS